MIFIFHNVLGNNLTSHFLEIVLNACEKLDVKFICLPNKKALYDTLEIRFEVENFFNFVANIQKN